MADVSLVVSLAGAREAEGELRKLSSVLKTLQDGAGAGLASWADGFATLGRVGAGALGVIAVGAAAAAAALKKPVMEVTELGAAMQSLHTQTGIATETLSGWKYAAEQSGTSAQAISTAVRNLSNSLSKQSEDTGRAHKALKALGVEALDPVTGQLRDAESLMMDVADKFSKLADGPQKMAMAVAIFGPAGAQLIEFLNKGRAGIAELTSEAAKFGVVIGSDTAKQADEFKNNLHALTTSAGSLGREIAVMLMPTITEITAQMRIAAREGGILSAVWQGMSDTFASLFVRSPTLGPDPAKIAEQKKSLAAMSEELLKLGQRQREQGELSPRDKAHAADLGAAYQKLAQDISKAELELFNFRKLATDRAGGDKPQAPTIPGNEPKAKKQKDEQKELLRLQDEGLRHAMDNMDMEIKAGRSTREEKITLIDAILAADVGSNNVRMQLLKEREQAVEQSAREEKKLQDAGLRHAMDNMDIEIKAGRMAAQEKVDLIDAVLAADVGSEAVRMQLLKERAKAIEDTKKQEIKISSEAAEEQIESLKKTALTYEELEAGIETVIAVLEQQGEAGKEAAEKLRRANKGALDQTARDAERMRNIYGRAGFDIVSVFEGVHGSLTRIFADILKGNASLAEGMKGIFKGIVDAIIGEFSRLIASAVVQKAIKILGLEDILGGKKKGEGKDKEGKGGEEGKTGEGGKTEEKTGFLGSLLKIGETIFGILRDTGRQQMAESTTLLAEFSNTSSGMMDVFKESSEGIMGTLSGVAEQFLYALGGMFGADTSGVGGFMGMLTGGSGGGGGGGMGGMGAGGGWAMAGAAIGMAFGLPPQLGGALGSIVGGFFATGGDAIVTSPTLIAVGETGPERLSVRPIAGAGFGSERGGGVHFHGPVVADRYSMRMFLRDTTRMSKLERNRYL